MMTSQDQGCQIFLGTTYKNGKNTPENIANSQNICIPNGSKIEEMSI
jgi:hypothetical protein